MTMHKALHPRDDRIKRRIYCIVNFALPTDHKGKIKEIEERDKYLDLARELRNLCNMKLMVLPTLIGVLGTVPKVSERRLERLEIKGQIEIIQTTALLRSARIFCRP